MQTNVKVRVQAHGGKYLGPALDSAPPLLWVQMPYSAPIGPFEFPTPSSGEVYKQPSSSTSPYPIIVQPTTVPNDYTPGTYYLGPANPQPNPDSYLIIALDLPPMPTPVTFIAHAFAPQPVLGRAAATLIGGNDYTAEPGVVVVVPGLRMTALQASGTTVTADVAMMCGCQITPNGAASSVAEPYWPAYEFNVTAQVAGMAVNLACVGNSSFAGTLPPGIPAGTPVTVTAVQQTTGNVNSVMTVVSQ